MTLGGGRFTGGIVCFGRGIRFVLCTFSGWGGGLFSLFPGRYCAVLFWFERGCFSLSPSSHPLEGNVGDVFRERILWGALRTGNWMTFSSGGSTFG